MQAAMAAKLATSTSVILIITPSASPKRSLVFMSFSRSGTLVRSSNVSPLRTQREDPEVVVLEVYRAEESLAETNHNSENA